MRIIQNRILIVFLLINVFVGTVSGQNLKADGYRGIWFTLGQFSEYGDKYSGGLGTYTANHLPLAIYAPKVDKTFFVYGGTTTANEKHLFIMVSYFDHQRSIVPKPVIVYDKMGVDDPHDNASLCVDEQGYLWIFVSGRGNKRPGLIFKSTNPYDINGFEQVYEGEMTYPQPYWVEGHGFFYLFTKYTKGRELYWNNSRDGKTWSTDQKLAGMGGHYQVSNRCGNTFYSVFNYHPDGNVDKRTNLYLLKTDDFGKTWKTIQGQPVVTPLTDPHHESLIRDFQAEGEMVYINDLNFDQTGNPVIFAVVSRGSKPGPDAGPRKWMIIHRKNGQWKFSQVCDSDHNYDMGSLYIEKDTWSVIGPSAPGPQKYGTGGEMCLWQSTDDGNTWKLIRNITHNSARNHSYARRPVNAHDDFYAFWADGNSNEFSESVLYFCNKKGDKVWALPYNMNGEYEKPKRIN